jgi:DNA helicase II / ATP-dependent DNA helicase PcrA
MTRAKDHLHVLVPQRFYVSQQAGGGDRHVYAGRTRFITDAMLQHFEQLAWPAAQQDAGTAVQPRTPVLQVRSLARSAWR